ncbi:hypothetical protein BB561_004874 [Smittium simulii]|uniref:CSC1/OSCA1-like 7TM region domain-containing protein n=1 Tax=Smittium simulii TaxID=133385 RepID=A0A2T9YDN9_9FUNG|nr:hypothetical protein BB561_004874 [Smittium simulii]
MDPGLQNNSLDTFISSVVVNGAICLAFFVLFSIFRTKNKYLYAPKTSLKSKALAPRLPESSLFGWLSAILKLDHDQVLQYCGPDGFMFLYFLRQNVFIFLILTIIGMGIILPINVTDSDDINGLNKTTMSNIRRGSPKLWAHVVFSMIFSFVVIFFNFIASAKAISIRQNYLNSPEYLKTLRSVTVLVTGIPSFKNTSENLKAAFTLKPEIEIDVYPAKFCKSLESTIETRDEMQLKLEAELTRIAKLNKKNSLSSSKDTKIKPITRNSTRTGFLGLIGEKKDIIDWSVSNIIENNNKIIEVSSDPSQQATTNSAFVVFKNIKDAHDFVYHGRFAIHKNIAYSRRYIDVDTEDVIWENLSINSYVYVLLRLVSIALSTLMVLFWIIITTLVAGIANLDNLRKLAPFEWVGNLPRSVLGFLQGIVPVVVLAILTMLIPIILRVFIGFEKPLFRSQIEYKLCDRFFYFLLFNNFFIYLIIGTAVGSLDEFISKPGGFITDFFKDPQKILNLVSSRVPSTSTFFTSYVLLLGLSSSSGNILQIVGLALRWLFGLLFTYTPRKSLTVNSPQQIKIGIIIPIISFIFLLGTIFSVIAPVMTLVSLVSFTLFFVVYKYNFVYVYKPQSFNYGGRLSRVMIAHRWAALYCFQVVMLFLLAINTKSGNKANSALRLALMIIILVVTVLSHIYFIQYVNKRIEYMDSIIEQKDTRGFLDSFLNKRIEKDMYAVDQYITKDYDLIYQDGYTLLGDPLMENQFTHPHLRDAAYTTIWVPQSEQPEMIELYNEVNIKLSDSGIVTDEDAIFKDNLKIKLNTDRAPVYFAKDKNSTLKH